MKGTEVISVNMHRLGESFVENENVSDVRRRATVDGKAAAPGESLECSRRLASRDAGTGPTATTERYRATGGVNGCSRN